jgi:hypothetical protein
VRQVAKQLPETGPLKSALSVLSPSFLATISSPGVMGAAVLAVSDVLACAEVQGNDSPCPQVRVPVLLRTTCGTVFWIKVLCVRVIHRRQFWLDILLVLKIAGYRNPVRPETKC